MRIRSGYLALFVAAFVLLVVAGGRTTFTQGASAGEGNAPSVPRPTFTCDLQQYKAASGLTAAVQQDLLGVTWAGQDGAEVRARFAIDNAKPVVRDIAVRKQNGQWVTLAENLSP